ncbi:MAG: hypothetical protein K9J17_16945 [Flavobacteriales bacterium]|nr:hypothetical protein [Flavobacteriales bacterium]
MSYKRRTLNVRNRIIQTVRTILLIHLFSVAGYAQVDYESLIVICKEQAPTDVDSIQLEILFFNNSNDTILLPTDDLDFENFTTVVFVDHPRVICSKMTKWAWPTKQTGCDIEYATQHGRTLILPYSACTIKYPIDDRGFCCVGVNKEFRKGEKVQFYVRFNIDERFKYDCDKIWSGKVSSTLGSFVIR